MQTNAEQLSTAELGKLRRWQKRMISYFIVFLLGTGLLLFIGLTVGFSQTVELVVTIVWSVFLVSGIFIQFSQKCPRCGFRIGLQSRLLLPPKCTKCGISFRA